MIIFRGMPFKNEAHWAAFSRGRLAKLNGGEKTNPYDSAVTPWYFILWKIGYEVGY